MLAKGLDTLAATASCYSVDGSSPVRRAPGRTRASRSTIGIRTPVISAGFNNSDISKKLRRK